MLVFRLFITHGLKHLHPTPRTVGVPMMCARWVRYNQIKGIGYKTLFEVLAWKSTEYDVYN